MENGNHRKQTFRIVRVGGMSGNDGLEVSLANYEEDINLQNCVRSDCMTDWMELKDMRWLRDDIR